jgi:periplasmic protein TonB
MSRRWWGGSGISIVFHAALLLVVLYAATPSSQIDATPAVASPRTKIVYTVFGVGSGFLRTSGGPAAAAPRTAHIPERRPLNLVPPQTLDRIEVLPIGMMPAIVTDKVDVLPGALMPVDGTALGTGSGAVGRGSGNGRRDGPGAGDVYESGTGGVSPPRLIREVKPHFTIDAMRAKIQGTVHMDAFVLADGSVDATRIRIVRSLDPGLDQQAILAVRQWRFHPSIRLGQPVASRVIVELAFTLR